MNLKYNDLTSVMSVTNYRVYTDSVINVSIGDIALVMCKDANGNISTTYGSILIFIIDSSTEAFFVGRVYTYGNIDTNTYIGFTSSVYFVSGTVSYSNYTINVPNTTNISPYTFIYSVS